MRLTGMPTRGLWPSRVKQKRSRHASVLMAVVPGLLRIFLECAHDEAWSRDRGDDLPESPEARVLFLPGRISGELEMGPADVDGEVLVEIALPPVHQPVDAGRGRVLVVQEHVSARMQRRGNAARPGVEVVQPVEDAAAGGHEVEATTQ